LIGFIFRLVLLVLLLILLCCPVLLPPPPILISIFTTTTLFTFLFNFPLELAPLPKATRNGVQDPKSTNKPFHRTETSDGLSSVA